MTLKFRNRIALFNTLAVAFTTAMVFLVIYSVVYKTAYSHLDDDILLEKEEVFSNLDWHRDSIIINKMPEWDEAEHNQVEVNPTFLQIADLNNKVIFRSTNLLENQTLSIPGKNQGTFYNGEINNQRVRLGHFPITNEASVNIGQLTIAVSQQESYNILNNLIWVLLITFPIVLIVQFVASSLAASKAIEPVNQLISSASGIGDSNISTRLVLPEHQDELYQLTQTINELLARIETSMLQQKQFTSDASHEIRTPLAGIRGTLEVLIRKQREPQIYEEKIAGTIKEVDRLDSLLEQLLQLARIDSSTAVRNETICLAELISLSGEKWKIQAAEKNVSLQFNIPEDITVMGDQLYLELILDNLLSNAIKYGKEDGNVVAGWDRNSKTLTIKDDGIGITSKDLPNIFNRFYRADKSRSSAVKGNGLGLSIVKKLADLQHINLRAVSQPDKGSTFMLQFPS
jgi:two-component system heavy metal sensor histidine kinase CusS